MKRDDLKIGLFGFGCVGQGLYDVLNNSRGIQASIEKIVVKDRAKKRSLPADAFSFDKRDILDNPDINLVVELIDNAANAWEIVKEAMQKGKHVVTANKKMVAEHLWELRELQERHNVSFLYEASSCGSIPIIRTLEEYYDNESLLSIQGIFNGTTNYILTKVIQEGIGYGQALAQAQEQGFAESDPTLDVQGFDALFKLTILAAHAFGIFLKPEDTFRYGITTLNEWDIRFAREKGWKIKLTPTCIRQGDTLLTFVMPQFIDASNPLFDVHNEYNGVVVEAFFSDKQFFKGKGAGSHPTGSAVLSDISAITYGYKYEYKKFAQQQNIKHHNDHTLQIYLRYDNEEVLKLLPFGTIHRRHHEYDGGYHYLVADVLLKDLITSGIAARTDAFLCVLPKGLV